MKVPVQITARDVALTDYVRDLIYEKCAKADRVYGGLVSCRVLLDVPHRRRHHGMQYRSRVELGVPGGKLVITTESPLGTTTALLEAFDAATRQLDAYASIRRGEVKRHARPVI